MIRESGDLPSECQFIRTGMSGEGLTMAAETQAARTIEPVAPFPHGGRDGRDADSQDRGLHVPLPQGFLLPQG